MTTSQAVNKAFSTVRSLVADATRAEFLAAMSCGQIAAIISDQIRINRGVFNFNQKNKE